MAERSHAPARVLVTGGAGFIGSNLVHWLLRRDPAVQVVTLDKLTYAADPAHLDGLVDPSRHELVVGDIADGELVLSLLREHRIDTVLHLAAESHVDRSISGPATFIHSNIVGTYALLEACRAFWLDQRGLGDRSARFHHVSTDEVYGDLGPHDPAFTERTAYQPSSPYSASKAASDHLVRAWARTYGLPVTVSNCSNNYGPRQHPEKLIPVVIKACRTGAPIPVYGTGMNVRDWLHVDDHAAAIWHIAQHGSLGETYNVGSDNEWANLDLVRRLCVLVAEETGRDSETTLGLIRFVTDRPGHDRRYAIDGAKLSALGWSAEISFDAGLRNTVRWYLGRLA